MRQLLRPRAIIATAIGGIIGYAVAQELPLPHLWRAFIAFGVASIFGPLILKVFEPDPA